MEALEAPGKASQRGDCYYSMAAHHTRIVVHYGSFSRSKTDVGCHENSC